MKALRPQSLIAHPVFVLLMAIAFSASLFRGVVASGFDVTVLDYGDGILIISIAEHWYLWARGLVSWADFPIFYPVENVLAYSDAFAFHGFAQIFWRSIGMDRYLAMQSSLVLLAVLGYIGFYLLGRRLGVRPVVMHGVSWVTLLSAPIFAKVVMSTHAQMSTVFLTPWVFWAGLVAITTTGWRSWAAAAGSALLLSLTLLTGFYLGWYLIFFVGVLIVVDFYQRTFSGKIGGGWKKSWVVELSWSPWKGFQDAWVWVNQNRSIVLVFGGVFLLSMLPFLILYLPALKQFGGRGIGVVFAQLPEWRDFINPGVSNYWWSEWMKSPGFVARPSSWELSVGLPPLSFLLLISAWLCFWVNGKRSHDTSLLFLGRRLVLSVLVIWLLMLRIGDFSLWALVVDWVPGAGAIRAVFRFNVFLALPIGLSVAILFELWLRRNPKPIGIASGFALLFIALVEQLGSFAEADIFRRSEALASLYSVTTAPEEAEWFYIEMDPAEGRAAGWRRHTLAIEIAQELGVPTVNGHTGQYPRGWRLFPDEAGEFSKNLDNWVRKHGLENGFRLDHKAGNWQPYSASSVPLVAEESPWRVEGRTLSALAGFGWSSLESWGFWSEEREADLKFRFPPEANPPSKLVFEIIGYTAKNHPSVRVDLFFNDQHLDSLELTLENSERRWEVSLNEDLIRDDAQTVRFVIDTPASPASLGRGTDRRQLGVGLRAMEIR